MKPVSSLLAAMAALLFLMGLVACISKDDGAATGGQAPAPESRAGESEELMVNRIAYVDNSGDLLLINPDSTGEERLTGNARAGMLSQALERGDSYYWPTWSHDGNRIAASPRVGEREYRRGVGATVRAVLGADGHGLRK